MTVGIGQLMIGALLSILIDQPHPFQNLDLVAMPLVLFFLAGLLRGGLKLLAIRSNLAAVSLMKEGPREHGFEILERALFFGQILDPTENKPEKKEPSVLSWKLPMACAVALLGVCVLSLGPSLATSGHMIWYWGLASATLVLPLEKDLAWVWKVAMALQLLALPSRSEANLWVLLWFIFAIFAILSTRESIKVQTARRALQKISVTLAVILVLGFLGVYRTLMMFSSHFDWKIHALSPSPAAAVSKSIPTDLMKPVESLVKNGPSPSSFLGLGGLPKGISDSLINSIPRQLPMGKDLNWQGMDKGTLLQQQKNMIPRIQGQISHVQTLPSKEMQTTSLQEWENYPSLRGQVKNPSLSGPGDPNSLNDLLQKAQNERMGPVDLQELDHLLESMEKTKMGSGVGGSPNVGGGAAGGSMPNEIASLQTDNKLGGLAKYEIMAKPIGTALAEPVSKQLLAEIIGELLVKYGGLLILILGVFFWWYFRKRNRTKLASGRVGFPTIRAKDLEAIRSLYEKLLRQKLSPEEELVQSYYIVERVFSDVGQGRTADFPVSLFGNRVVEKYPQFGKPVPRFAKLFNQIFYGAKSITSDDLQFSRQSLRRLLSFLQIV